MIVFPNCKINIGLYITEKRSDGFHNLETVFFPIKLNDALEVVSQADTQSFDIEFSQTGLVVDAPADKNLCVKAFNLLKAKFPQLTDIKMHLHKAIPMGAGLGGGSADGAFALKALNNYFSLGLSNEELIALALQLGSDCPFFIINEPCYATGRGEILEKINIDLAGYTFVLVNPGIHINTGWAFSKITPQKPPYDLKKAILNPVEEWKQSITNQFEQPVFEAYPEIGEIKSALYNAGAVYASMSGSGSTVYGIFKKGYTPKLNFPDAYMVKVI